MLYAEARPLIETGDLIAVKGKSGPLAPLTKFFTRSEYTHVGVAFWMNDGLWLAETNAGNNHAIPCSQLEHEDIDVFKCPKALDKSRLLYAIHQMLRVKVPYGFTSLFIIGLADYMNFRVKSHDESLLSCAGFSGLIYELCGWPIDTHLISPQKLTERLEMRFAIKATPQTKKPHLHSVQVP